MRRRQVSNEIFEGTSDGGDNALGYPRGIAVGSDGTVYIPERTTDNAFGIVNF